LRHDWSTPIGRPWCGSDEMNSRYLRSSEEGSYLRLVDLNLRLIDLKLIDSYLRLID